MARYWAARCSHCLSFVVGLGKERDEEQIQSKPPLEVSGGLKALGRWIKAIRAGVDCGQTRKRSEAPGSAGGSGPRLELVLDYGPVFSELSGRSKSWGAVVSNNGRSCFVRQRSLVRLCEMKLNVRIENDWFQASPACSSLEMMMMPDQRRTRTRAAEGGNGDKKRRESLLATTWTLSPLLKHKRKRGLNSKGRTGRDLYHGRDSRGQASRTISTASAGSSLQLMLLFLKTKWH